MNTTAKTIQIFLPGGDPRGIRVAEITTRIVQVIEVPRSLLQDFLRMPESEQVAIYFLFSDEQDGAAPTVYIGQTGDLRARLVAHNQRKDFWQRCLVLVSRTNNMHQTHAHYLEWFCLKGAKAAGRYLLENGNAGSEPHTTAPLQAECVEIFETGRTLLATLGYPLFEAVASSPPSAHATEVFYCTVAGVNGRGLYTPEGFVVLKGSTGRRENGVNFAETHQRFRKKLVDAEVMREQGDIVIFEKDHLFGSPSMAAMALLGRTSNGWKEWKSKEGRTLDEVKRTSTEALA